MVRSMTGFGRGVTTTEQLQLTVEIRSVNHRFLEISTRFPKEWTEVEVFTKKLLSTKVARGKLDVSVNVKEMEPLGQSIHINWPLVNAYIEAQEELSSKLPLTKQWSMAEILGLEEVVTVKTKELSKEEVLAAIELATEEAASVLVGMRQREGLELLEAVQRLKAMLEAQITIIQKGSAMAVEKYRSKLLARIQEICQADHVEERVLMEVAVFAEKADIAEEIDRLSSHLKQVDETLRDEAAIGRKLDFLMQEMNREINTIGAKNQSAEVASAVVEAKSILEKMREQVQNIE
ncbi:YicC/YloC family endoribonuclease [Rummeliibacillus stabekisii]|uniref:YicC family protein n=1 Tax=Rummeliibacillus stabekisii TaxID=241244 RepID=A0A143HA95_9BACL|nr:YicC/YloC family endoribonuclease [Rummeliibacillus stabekisii]AMW98369.1 YicC family protein [Rummeliibacillus stabekisii]